MYSDVNDDDVLLWTCFDCRISGALTRPPVADSEDVARAIARAHAERMPGCARAFHGVSVHDFRAHDWLRSAMRRIWVGLAETPYEARCRMALDERVAELSRSAAPVIAAVKVIHAWHNLQWAGTAQGPGLHRLMGDAWRSYWRHSPEMAPIREALPGLNLDNPEAL